MPFQEVVAKIIFNIAPDGVDMVRVVLGVIVFQQKCRSLHAVVLALAGFDTTSPREKESVPARFFNLGPVGIRQFSAVASDEFQDQCLERFTLLSSHFAGAQAQRFKPRDFACIAGENVIRGDVGGDGNGALLGIK